LRVEATITWAKDRFTTVLRTSQDQAAYFDTLAYRTNLCRDTRRSNCIGTALYLSSENSSDKYVDTSYAYQINFQNLKLLDQPVVGCLVAWRNLQNSDGMDVYHAGIVVSIDPLLITHRCGIRGPFIEKEQIENVQEHYSRLSPSFFLPNALKFE
jgi:hypothetical protein